MSHKSKRKRLSYHSEASFLPPSVPAPPPAPVSSPSKMLCARKYKFFWLHFCSFLLSSWLPLKTREQSKWPGSPPQRLTCVRWEESGRGSAHSGAGCSDSDHRLFCAGCPSPSKSSIPSPKQQAVCLHSATFGMHEHGCRERGGGFLKKVQGLRKRHLTRLPSSRKPLP